MHHVCLGTAPASGSSRPVRLLQRQIWWLRYAAAVLSVGLAPCLVTANPPADHRSPLAGSVLSIHADDLGEQPPLPSTGGLREDEAVAMLRLFYAQENQNAPEPQKRTKKQLALAQQANIYLDR